MTNKKKSTAIVLYNEISYYWQILFNVPKQSPLPFISEKIITDENTICDMGIEDDPYKNWVPPTYIFHKQNRTTNPKYLKRKDKV